MRFRDWSIKVKALGTTILILLFFSFFAGWFIIHLRSLLSDIRIVADNEQNVQYVRDATLLDDTLKTTVRIYVMTPSASVKEKYTQTNAQLTQLIEQQMQKHAGSGVESGVKAAHDARGTLTLLESQMQQAAEAGESQKAAALLDSEEYTTALKVYDNTLSDYLSVTEGMLHTALTEYQKKLARTVQFSMYFCIFFVCISLLAAIFISRYFVNSVRSLHRVIVAIGRGNFEERVPVNSKDEFGELAIAFNKLALSVEQACSKDEDMPKRLKHITSKVGV